MNKIIILIIIALPNLVHAQATGNVIYNSNNRFLQNDNYKSSNSGKKYMSSQPDVKFTGDFRTTNVINDNFMLSQFVPNSDEVWMNINVLYNAKPTGYMAIFHLNQSGKKISELDTQVSRKVN